MAPRRIFTLHRIVAVLACGIFAAIGSVMFFWYLMFGSIVPPGPAPAPRSTIHALQNDGVTTRAEPLFAIDRQGDEAISLLGKASHLSIEQGEREEMAIAIGVQAWESSQQSERKPIDLALVFDVSGSMRGEPLMDVQAAAVALLDSLGPQDRVAIVAYSSDAWLVAPKTRLSASNRSDLKRKIQALNADGGTNISGGWELGYEQIQMRDRDSVRRVMLLSDGQANEGIVDIGTLANMTGTAMEWGVTTTSLGVGLDYNEDLLQSMARRGGGNYYFVYDNAPATSFDQELASLTSNVTSRATLHVEILGGPYVSRVEGFEWRAAPEGGIVIELGSLTEGMRRDVLIELEPVKVFEPVRIEAELKWEDRAGVAQVARWNQFIQNAETKHEPVVMSRLQKVRTVRTLTEATRVYESGQRLQAAKLLEEMVESNEDFVDEYDVDEDTFDRANDRLSSLAGQMREYEPNSRRGLYMIKGSKYESANVAVDSSVTF